MVKLKSNEWKCIKCGKIYKVRHNVGLISHQFVKNKFSKLHNFIEIEEITCVKCLNTELDKEIKRRSKHKLPKVKQ
jgi:hypothetical protein